MDDDIREFGQRFADAVLKKDWDSAFSLLAPGLRKITSADALRAFIENEYRATLDASSISDMHYPEDPSPQIDGNNFMKAADLRKPDPYGGAQLCAIADELSDQNLKYWMSIQFLCSESQQTALGFDFFAETWLAVINTAEGLRVGYLKSMGM